MDWVEALVVASGLAAGRQGAVAAAAGAAVVVAREVDWRQEAQEEAQEEAQWRLFVAAVLLLRLVWVVHPSRRWAQ